MNTPLVTAVMVTGKSPERRRLMEAAVRAFDAQTWSRKELLVINDSGEPWLASPATNHREIVISDKLTLGALRNLGLDHAAGDWIIQWDDDDWYHPDRISDQMRRRQPGCAVLLRCQVRYSMQTKAAYVNRYTDHGTPGTILHPRTKARYPEVRKHEDSTFAKAAFANKFLLLENANKPELYLRFAHGANTWSHSHIMRKFAKRPGQSSLPPAAANYLRQVLKREYGEPV